MTKAAIRQLLADVINQQFALSLKSGEIAVEIPTQEVFGDFTTNIAMSLNKFVPEKDKQSPIQFAEKIVKILLEQDKNKNFSKIEVAKPGFINFTVSTEVLNNFLQSETDSLQHRLQSNEQRTTLIEFLQPNTNKPLHIGHLRNSFYGQALVNLHATVGESVISANLNNDRGIHIIKSMYGYLQFARRENNQIEGYKTLLAEWSAHPEHWHTPQSLNLKPDHFIGKFYVLGNTEYENSEADESKKDLPSAPHNQMQDMLILWEKAEPQIRALWQTMNNWFYQGMHQTLQTLQIHSPNHPDQFFDKEWYESQIYQEGKDIIMQNLNNGVITEFEDGHVEAELQSFNLPNIVLLRKNKTSLYITQDIELMRTRLINDKVDQVVIITASEQDLRFKQLFAVCESLHIGIKEQMVHLGHGMVRTPEGKMSSRKGNVIIADDLIAEVQAAAKQKINDERQEFSEQEKTQIANDVALAAIKYGMLKYNAQSNIIFDIQNNISFEGDTGPYLQYTHARASSILRKADIPSSLTTSFTDYAQEESELLHALLKYPDVLISAAANNSPNYLTEFLFNCAQKFNHFYTVLPILSEENTSKKEARLLITLKTVSILKSALEILGIQAPEKM